MLDQSNSDSIASVHGPLKFDSSKFRQVEVYIYTMNGIFIGSTLCQHQQRLLDALNKGFYSPKLQTFTDFMPVFNVVLKDNTESKQRMDTVYIRKSNILFVGEITPEHSAVQPNVYPVRRKKPLQAIINLPQISLRGNMHSEMWEELQEALNRSDQFIPTTDVSFNPPLLGNIKSFPFVAVNKDHIVYVGK